MVLAAGSVGEVLAIAWFAGVIGGVLFATICRWFGGTVQVASDIFNEDV
jgi:uncharacterized membrane protein